MNNSSRESALNFIQEVLVRNAKRQQLQVNERMVAGDGFMLNFLSVMQHLSAKVVIDKVDPFYLLSPKSRINISEDTRLNMTSKEASEWMEEFSKDPGFEWKEAKLKYRTYKGGPNSIRSGDGSITIHMLFLIL